ncbi:creatininase family protein [Natronorubrum sp. FCH18a]|uniref:creatininase family protein n=1 Tax=Natronorubrum sp. FCH18a TaxID=3447018 RepID=UPI003F5196C1
MCADMFEETWLTKPYAEIVDIAGRNGSILMVPVGSLEQHGRHLPTGTDTILATAAARAGTDRLDDDVPVLLAPPIWAGYSPHHLPFGGTITVEHDTFIDTITDIVDSAANSGFDAVTFVNGHGGNKSLLSTAVSVAGGEHPEMELSTFLYLDLLGSDVEDIKQSDVPGVHGGELETSLMLSIRPDLVDEDSVSTTPQHEPYDRAGADLLNGGPVTVYRSFDEYTETGTLGEPAAASAATGERTLELVGEEIATVLESIHEHVRTIDS